MNSKFVVVDGSNIATEGRSTPSLDQLDEAVSEFQRQFPDQQVIVVVDATFGHRIDPSERKAFDEAIAHGEIVSPPAGAIGRGDAFLLRIAERVTAQILSNDSFQEFHSDHPWLFDEGRLIGGTPVPGIGWIFTPRIPVRSPRGRATKTSPRGSAAAQPVPRKAPRKVPQTKAPATPAKRAPAKKVAKQKKGTQAAPAKKATKATKAPKREAPPPAKKASSSAGRARKQATKASKASKTAKVLAKATKVAKKAARPEKKVTGPAPKVGRSRPRREADAGLEGATNDPVTFLEFVSEHPIGSRVEGQVTSFTSHGAMVDVGQMHCYVPLKGLGVPAPTSAREVLKRGDRRAFVLIELDVARRGAELALPAVASRGRSTRQRSR